MFFQKKKEIDAPVKINSEEFETLCKKLVELSSRFEVIENKQENLRTDVLLLRARLNKKIEGVNPTPPQQEPERKSLRPLDPFYSDGLT